MDVSFVRAKDGAPYARLGPAWVGFDEALADAVSPLPPRGSAEHSVSTYWIDRALTQVRRMVNAGETGPIQGGNATTLSVVGGEVVASSDYDTFEPESMTVEAFEEVLRAWRDEVVRVRDEERPQIPETYRRNPYPGDEVSALTTAGRTALGPDLITLWRPTGPEELALVEASGWRRWPSRLPDQPIFYPVLNEDYAVRIARDWNVKASGIGFVTRFQVRREHLDQYEVQQVGGETILEYWIPAERLDDLNDNIVGTIEVVQTFRRA